MIGQCDTALSALMTTLTSPHDLLAAIPFLIGYHPTDSLVLVSLRDESVGMAMRVDYPQDPFSENTTRLIDSLVMHLLREGGDGALVVAYAPIDRNDAGEMLDILASAIRASGISVREALQVHAGRWRSTLCNENDCCPPLGRELPEISASRIAAEQVATGRPMPFLDSRALTDSISSLELSLDPHFCSRVAIPGTSQKVGAICVIDLASRFISGAIGADIVSDQELSAKVISALGDIQVRDFALGSHSESTLPIYSMMWRYLLRIAPVGYVAPVACLLAALSYENGDGALANRCLDRAIKDDPTYSLATLLRRVFSAAWPPEAFSAMRKELHPKVCASIFDAPAVLSTTR